MRRISGGRAFQEEGTGSTGAVRWICLACSRKSKEVGEAGGGQRGEWWA